MLIVWESEGGEEQLGRVWADVVGCCGWVKARGGDGPRVLCLGKL